MQSMTTAWRHEHRYGIPVEVGQMQNYIHDPPMPLHPDLQPDDHEGGGDVGGGDVDHVPPGPWVQVSDVDGSLPEVRVARETLALIASQRLLQSGATSINKVYAKFYGPHLPPNMTFGYVLFSCLLLFHSCFMLVS